MKRITSLIAALSILLCLTGCGGADVPPDYSFTFGDIQIAMNAEAAPILAALGEAKGYTEERSCAFTGLDKTYDYGSFCLTTCPIDGEDFVYSLWFADDSVSTEEGIRIGSPQADVRMAYGGEHYNGINTYIMEGQKMKLTIILTDGIVTGVRYDAVID